MSDESSQGFNPGMVLLSHAERIAKLESGYRGLLDQFAEYRQESREYRESSQIKLDTILATLQTREITHKVMERAKINRDLNRSKFLKLMAQIAVLGTAISAFAMAILKWGR